MGEACRQLGPGDPQLYKDALRAFDEAADADPGDPAPRTARGSLYLAKYDSVSARQTLKAVLERNPAAPRRAPRDGARDGLRRGARCFGPGRRGAAGGSEPDRGPRLRGRGPAGDGELRRGHRRGAACPRDRSLLARSPLRPRGRALPERGGRRVRHDARPGARAQSALRGPLQHARRAVRPQPSLPAGRGVRQRRPCVSTRARGAATPRSA